MLGGNCEKMVVISSTTNEWPQNQITDEKSLMPSIMEKSQPQQQQQQQQQQQALKCPRCDSSNTKFCYYNNYSLSQPRHFCKACKRYWTRGGTLRNVPVGGGCRKNKRVKRPAAVASSSSTIEGGGITTANPNNNPSSNSQTQNDYLSSNPLFYGLPTNPNPSEMNLPIFPGRFNSRSVVDSISEYHDLQPQLNALALGFSSGIMTSGEANNGATGFNNLPIFGSSHSSTATTSPTMATLLASTLHQKFGIKDTNHYPSLTPNFEDLRMGTGNNNESSGICMKQVKIEQDQNSRLEWNQIEQLGGFSNSSSDPSLFWNNTNPTSVSAWHDPTNIGSSVTSLI